MTEDIIVTYGDTPMITPDTYRKLVELRRRADADASVLTVRVPPESRYGRVIRDDKGDVVRVVEWKDATPGEREIDEGNAGVYCFRSSALWAALDEVRNDNVQGEYYLPDVVGIFLRNGGRVVSMVSDIPGEEMGVNTPEDLAACECALKERGIQ